jgi:hypothetical protein
MSYVFKGSLWQFRREFLRSCIEKGLIPEECKEMAGKFTWETKGLSGMRIASSGKCIKIIDKILRFFNKNTNLYFDQNKMIILSPEELVEKYLEKDDFL